MDPTVPEELLAWLESVHLEAEPAPWVALVEGRDFLPGGDSFVMVGTGAERGDDMYIWRSTASENETVETPWGTEEVVMKNVPGAVADLDVIAVSRTYLPVLIAEIRRLRARLDELPSREGGDR